MNQSRVSQLNYFKRGLAPFRTPTASGIVLEGCVCGSTVLECCFCGEIFFKKILFFGATFLKKVVFWPNLF